MLFANVLLAASPPDVPGFLIIPFALLIGLIATGPIFFPNFWHHQFKNISVGLGLLVLAYYLFVLHDTHLPAETLAEYASFAILLSSLYIASGGIYINANANATPLINVGILLFGAVIANIIGTTGASLLLIRPFIRLNNHRIKPYQIVFFIFIVSNAGGMLTPLGDPPLFIGFLKGVPFFWTLQHLFTPWALAVGSLCAIFFVLDSRNKEGFTPKAEVKAKIEAKTEFFFTGKRNLLWLAVIIGATFLNPASFDWLPYIPMEGGIKVSFVRELVQLSAAFLCFKFASRTALNGNHFTFDPILEVVFLFFGIFFTMMPALQLSAELASSPEFAAKLTPTVFYWVTGSLSGVLDNAPTYANFLSLGMAKYHLNYANTTQVHDFAYGLGQTPETLLILEAISIGAVLFGAMTYIGNGPNFMVKSIAEQAGVKMPPFFQYMFKYSLIYLLPVLALIWLLVIY
ncbi:sodium:proton antiporter [Rufibacter sediminis]|uniref:Sodium:proton antiporter n=1 Tax=Rufibacter sediminis TaxID=2762756 RepID=A0ABR6VNE4_9BACT|nr:sodium:proton antiporter [Rufibacter sediminis]MBC3538410.1 sodium:proton antiporter [Rufibacter sediminis]